jgi:hypothetical protein
VVCDPTITSFEDGKTPTNEIHVAETGSNTLGDGSAGSPYRSIEHAAGFASPGTAIVVHEGAHVGGNFISGLRGTADAPIWIGGAAGEARPLIQGGSVAMQLSMVSHVVIHDLEMSGASSIGINCDDGGMFDDPMATHHVVFRDLYIHDVGTGGNEDCLKLAGVNDYLVLDSEMHDCGGGTQGSLIDHVGCHRGLVARNHLHDASGNAVQIKGGSEDIEVRANRIINGGERGVNAGGATGLSLFRPSLSQTAPNFEAKNVRVVANLIQGGTTAIAYVGCVDCLVANNTIIDPENWLLRILQETVSVSGFEFTPVSNGRFINNLVSFDRSALSTYVNIGPNTSPDTFVFANNVWYAHDDAAQSQPDLPTAESNGVVGSDPALDASFAIAAGSPAAGAGQALPEQAGGDLAANCYGAPPSIGAYALP